MSILLPIMRHIRVDIGSFYIREYSNPAENLFMWAYRVSIRNDSPYSVRIMGRSWNTYTCHGCASYIKGKGISNQQPLIVKGKVFEYVSSIFLHAPFGVISGSYTALVLPDQEGDADDVSLQDDDQVDSVSSQDSVSDDVEEGVLSHDTEEMGEKKDAQMYKYGSLVSIPVSFFALESE